MQGLFGVDSPFYRFMWKLVQLLWLNLLWFLCSLPLVTLGASTTALYYVAMKMAKDQEGYIARDFFKAFQMNFKQATVIWLILAPIGIVLGVNLLYYWILDYDSSLFIRVVFTVLTAIYSMVCLFVFPALAKFENSIRNTMHFAVVMSIRNMIWAVLAIGAEIVIIGISLALYGFPFLIAGSAAAFLQAFIMNHIFDSFIEKRKSSEENSIMQTEEEGIL